MYRRTRSTTLSRSLAGGVAALLLAGCTLVGSEQSGTDEPTGSDRETGRPESGPVTLLTHDSFSLPKRLLRRFQRETGRRLVVRPSGDAGQLTTSLALSAGNPQGDVAFGVDNTFASRALSEGVFAPVEVDRPAGAEQYDLPEGEDRMVPVDHASVCVNVDDAWFAEEGLAPPEDLDDLTEPRYRGLFVAPGASTSSPGLAFLLATVAEYGEEWPSYWEDLMANDAKLVKGWTDAYYVDYTFSGGDRPIVVSYDTSPAFTTTDDGSRTTTSALLETCFRQVEYAGVLAGTENPEGARRVVEFLLEPAVQRALPRSMYVFGVRDDVQLPADWARFAERPDDPATLDPAEIASNREQWLTEWTDITTR